MVGTIEEEIEYKNEKEEADFEGAHYSFMYACAAVLVSHLVLTYISAPMAVSVFPKV